MGSYFERLNSVDVNEHTEKKNGLTYLSWAWAWAEVKKAYPDATYKIYENEAGWFYHTDGKTAWVKTGVTVNGIEHIEYLPVMDYRNKSIPANNITSFDVNKAIQRSLTKACARHGLGLYIYAGEDLPEDAPRPTPEDAPRPTPEDAPRPTPEDAPRPTPEDAPRPTREELMQKLIALAESKDISEEKLCAKSKNKVKSFNEMTDEQLASCIVWLKARQE